MSSFRQAMIASNGVINYMNRFVLPDPHRKSHRAIARHLNGIVMEFGREFGIEMARDNSPRYKGSFDPFSHNCIAIQDNFEKFANWMNSKYLKKD